MPQITPFMISDYTEILEKVAVNWRSDGTNWSSQLPTIHSVGSSEQVAYPASFIECQHPEGKLWHSLFVSSNNNGSEGFSVTWWGKSINVKGQFQIKFVSEQEWYSVVKSKVGSGGYGIVSYIGRTVPLNVNHGFVKTIVSDESISQLPVMAFTEYQTRDLGIAGSNLLIGKTVASAIANFVPIGNFLNRVHAKTGMNISKQIYQDTSRQTMTRNSADFIEGLALVGLLPNSGWKSEVEKIPEVDREAEYGGGWGAFG